MSIALIRKNIEYRKKSNHIITFFKDFKLIFRKTEIKRVIYLNRIQNYYTRVFLSLRAFSQEKHIALIKKEIDFGDTLLISGDNINHPELLLLQPYLKEWQNIIKLVFVLITKEKDILPIKELNPTVESNSLPGFIAKFVNSIHNRKMNFTLDEIRKDNKDFNIIYQYMSENWFCLVHAFINFDKGQKFEARLMLNEINNSEKGRFINKVFITKNKNILNKVFGQAFVDFSTEVLLEA